MDEYFLCIFKILTMQVYVFYHLKIVRSVLGVYICKDLGWSGFTVDLKILLQWNQILYNLLLLLFTHQCLYWKGSIISVAAIHYLLKGFDLLRELFFWFQRCKFLHQSVLDVSVGSGVFSIAEFDKGFIIRVIHDSPMLLHNLLIKLICVICGSLLVFLDQVVSPKYGTCFTRHILNFPRVFVTSLWLLATFAHLLI